GAGIGAFFSVQHQHPFLLVLLYAAVAGALVGVLVGLPSLRVRGLYLLLATLAFHHIAVYAFLKYQKANFGEVGALFRDPSLAFGWELSTDTRWYFFLLTLAVLTVIGAENLLRTR